MAKNGDKAPDKAPAMMAPEITAPGVRMAKDSGDYKAGKEITTDPAASFDPKGKGPVRVHPARMEAWLRDGIAERHGQPAAPPNVLIPGVTTFAIVRDPPPKPADLRAGSRVLGDDEPRGDGEPLEGDETPEDPE